MITRQVYIDYVALTELAQMLWRDNPKDHDLGLLHQSLDAYGYVNPVIVNEESNELLAGHGRVKTCMQRKAAGGAAPGGVVVEKDEWLLPVVRGISLDREKGHRYVVMDNRSTECGGWEEQKLADVLAQMAAEGMVKETGYDKNDLDRILSDLAPGGYDDGNGNGDGYTEVDIRIRVPAKQEHDVKEWLANGEPLTAEGMGRGVMRRCLPSSQQVDAEEERW